MTEQSQQQETFDINEIAALAAAKFGGADFTPEQVKEEDEPNAQAVQEPVQKQEEVVVPAETENVAPAADGNKEPDVQSKEQAPEVKPAELDPMLKALLDAAQPKQEEKKEPEHVVENDTSKERVEKTPENVHEQPAQAKSVTPNELLTQEASQFLQEYRDLDEQTFKAMDMVAEAHSRSQAHNLEQAVVVAFNQLQAQIAQQGQIIAALQQQLSGVHTKVTAPTLDDDITAMKNDPAVAAYLPYMQNILNGQDINAKMQLVNTWKNSKSTATSAQPVQPVTQTAPVIERRTKSVDAAAEATAALANKTQGSMVQPSDEIDEGMKLAAARFGPNR